MQTPVDIGEDVQTFEWTTSSFENETSSTELPIDMRFNSGHMLSIIGYVILMVISATGNIAVLILILRRRRTMPSRINMMLMHLAIADLLVTFLLMPLEIGWNVTVSWKAGDVMCRLMMFLRMFGLCLSSFVLVCISIDRYYAILKPLNLTAIDRRGKYMITGAWIASTVCCLPQMYVFHLEQHPTQTWYEQCITYNTFPTYEYEMAYSLFGMVVMYGFPLSVIVFSYTSILLEIFRKSRDTNNDNIRRSSIGFLGRARVRTLKMTIIIVCVFIICWTPYYVMSMWYWFDKESAKEVDQRVQKALFLFACTNSCMNPVVYGAFNIRTRRRTRCDTGMSHGPDPASTALQIGELSSFRKRGGSRASHNSNSPGRLASRTGSTRCTNSESRSLVSWKQHTNNCDSTTTLLVTATPTLGPRLRVDTSPSNGDKCCLDVAAATELSNSRRRDICLSCGESFEMRTTSGLNGLCSMNGK